MHRLSPEDKIQYTAVTVDLTGDSDMESNVKENGYISYKKICVIDLLIVLWLVFGCKRDRQFIKIVPPRRSGMKTLFFAKFLTKTQRIPLVT